MEDTKEKTKQKTRIKNSKSEKVKNKQI